MSARWRKPPLPLNACGLILTAWLQLYGCSQPVASDPGSDAQGQASSCSTLADKPSPWTAQLLQPTDQVYAFAELMHDRYYRQAIDMRLLAGESVAAGTIPVHGFDDTFVQIGTSWTHSDGLHRFIRRELVDMASLQRNSDADFYASGDPKPILEGQVANADATILAIKPTADGGYKQVEIARLQAGQTIGIYDKHFSFVQTSPWLQWIAMAQLPDETEQTVEVAFAPPKQAHVPTGASHPNTVTLRTYGTDSSGQERYVQCTAFFVGECWIHTAKHCVQDDPKSGFQVRRNGPPFAWTTQGLFDQGIVVWLDNEFVHPERDEAIIFMPITSMPQGMAIENIEIAQPDQTLQLPMQMLFDGRHQWKSELEVHVPVESTWSQLVWVTHVEAPFLHTIANGSLGSGGFIAGGDSGGPLYTLGDTTTLYGSATNSAGSDSCFPEQRGSYTSIDKAWLAQTLYDSVKDGVLIDGQRVMPPGGSLCRLPSWAQSVP